MEALIMFENTQGIIYYNRKVWCLKSRVQCVNRGGLWNLDIEGSL